MSLPRCSESMLLYAVQIAGDVHFAALPMMPTIHLIY